MLVKEVNDEVVAQGHELDKIAKQILWNCKSRDKFYFMEQAI